MANITFYMIVLFDFKHFGSPKKRKLVGMRPGVIDCLFSFFRVQLRWILFYYFLWHLHKTQRVKISLPQSGPITHKTASTSRLI